MKDAYVDPRGEPLAGRRLVSALDSDDVLDIALRTVEPDEIVDDGDLASSPWRVTDETSAEWALLKIRQAKSIARSRNRAALAMIAELHLAIDDLRERVQDNDRQAQRTVEHFEALLFDWHRRVLEDDPTAKSIRLGAGLLKSRMTPGRVVSVADPDSLPEDLRRVRVEADKAAIAKHIRETGELLPGVEWERPHRRHEVVL